MAFGEELDVASVHAMFDMLGGAWHKQFSLLNRENRQPKNIDRQKRQWKEEKKTKHER